ncbi:MAG: ShET2/EspL2 family type III secretion system effector toxin [Endozoicomonas sp. (ex Botrylloides leachii)]|nr:ShET2/EspL2 family type III secretion system effector toxin [Endozoicomonas sp. (ex Botrylloides leachii)]
MDGFYKRISDTSSESIPSNEQEPSDGKGNGRIKTIDPEQTYLSAADKTASASSPPTTSLMQRKVTHLLQQKPARELYIRSGVNPQSELTQLIDEELPVDYSLILAYKSKGLERDFNCKATSKKDQQLITCRHLAYAFATGVFGEKIQDGKAVAKGQKFAGVDSLDKIANHPSIPTDEQLGNTPEFFGIAKEGYYFAGQAIGLSIHRAAQKLSYEWDSKCYLVHSENHSMALAIERLADSSFKLAFYEPGDTTRVRRIVVSNLEALKKITIKDLIPNSNDAAQCLLGAAHGGLLCSTDTVKTASDAQIEIDGNINASIMQLLMQRGHLGNKDTKDRVYKQLQLNSNDQAHLERIFEGKSTNGGTPALFIAMQNGHPETITAFFKGIKSLGLANDKAFLKDLVTAERKDETPGLFMAIQFGHPETITAFFEGIKSLGLAGDKNFLKDLVTAENKDGIPGLLIALHLGRPKTIEALFTGVENLDMSAQDKNDLLKNPLWNGLSGIKNALQEEKEATVATYLNLMMKKKFITPETLNNALNEVVSSNKLTLEQLMPYFTNMIKHNRATADELKNTYENQLKNYGINQLSTFWGELQKVRP